MLAQAAGWLLYIFTVVTTLALVAGLPTVLIDVLIEHRRTRSKALPILITILIAAGFLTGAVVGWSLRPSGWHLPLRETIDAATNAEKYGHAVEGPAERLLLFILFTGDLGAVVVGLAAMAGRSRVGMTVHKCV